MTGYTTQEQSREAWRQAMRHDSASSGLRDEFLSWERASDEDLRESGNGCAFSQTRRATLLIGALITLTAFVAVIWVVIHR